MRKHLIITTLFSAALAAPATATPPDDAWLAFVGCWRAENDTSERSLCIVPDGDGVRSIILNGSRIESETRMVANGQARNIDQEGCTGTETARWSADRQRVFINAQLNCGNGVTRNVSGIFAVLGGSRWASIQSIGTADNTTMHTVRYVEAAPADLPAEIALALRNNRLARETVRLAAATELDLADVRDAVAHVDAQAVEGWLTTVDQQFDLSGRDLIELADAGVPGSIIDVLVAVSNPAHFAVREERAEERSGGRVGVPGRCYDAWYDPYGPFAYRDFYGYGSRYSGYGCRTPWGGGYWGGGYWGGGTVIVIDRPSSGNRTRGRVTREGYKAPTTGTTTSTGSNPPRSSGSTRAGSGGSSSSDGGGRKAKPRDNNNNNNNN